MVYCDVYYKPRLIGMGKGQSGESSFRKRVYIQCLCCDDCWGWAVLSRSELPGVVCEGVPVKTSLADCMCSSSTYLININNCC